MGGNKGKRQQEEKRGDKDKDKTEKKAKAEALDIIGSSSPLRGLVVFDLDYTLWPFYSECPPKRDAAVLYPQARPIISAFHEKGINIALASCSSADNTVNSLLDKFGLQSMFLAKEVFTSSCHKKEHFQKIKQATGLPYQSMLFFDDGTTNIDTVSKMGVSCTLVKKEALILKPSGLALKILLQIPGTDTTRRLFFVIVPNRIYPEVQI